MNHQYQPVLRFIHAYWSRITWTARRDQGLRIGLPHPFVSPNAHVFKYDQFYWDSYFTILGLLADGKVKLSQGIVENFAYAFKRFGIIPSRNRFYNTGISQPPFFTSMILEVFAQTQDLRWLARMAKVAEQELATYWMYDGSGLKAEVHQVYKGLSRYADHYITHLTAEHESGWDMTSRFQDHCLNFLPVDLNSLLYKYEIDLASIYTLLKQPKRAAQFKRQAAARRRVMQKLYWNEKVGYFFDYNYQEKKQSTFYSLAGMYALWAGWATPEQAAQVVKVVRKKFETPYGLVNTQKENLSKEFKQWDYPHGWANQQWIVFTGLRRYGFLEDAARIGTKWMDLNARLFKTTGKMWEKYDVIHGKIGLSGHYKSQYGFGWTNAVFLKMYQALFPE